MLLRKIPGPLLIAWDGSPIHRADVVKPFLASPMGKRVHLERFPGYAPALNPQEQVWNLLKRRELKNQCCRDLAHLRQELIHAKERLRHRQGILQHSVTRLTAVAGRAGPPLVPSPQFRTRYRRLCCPG